MSSNCNYTWINQTSGTLNVFYSVKAVSELVCWIGGANGTILKTTNGGNNWINGNPNTGVISGDILNIEATDENNAWVTTSPPSSNTFIYKTTNGGNNWVQVYTNPNGKINGIKMLSSTNGFAFGDPVSGTWNILVTSNGGTNWSAFPTSPTAVAGEQGIKKSFFVMPPYIWFGASFGSVYRSSNNGVNWMSYPTTGIGNYIFAVHFNSEMVGLASGISMVKSSNSGITYFPQSLPGVGNIDAIEGRDSNFWVVRQTQIYRSTNNGVNWSSVYTGSNTLQDIDFPDNTSGCLTGWAVGFGGTIAKMTGTLTGAGSSPVSKFPENYKLYQNYPNPFNPETKIQYDIPGNSYVTLKVYDLLGRETAVLVNEIKQAGSYLVSFNSSELACGVYYYRIEAGKYSETKKMLLIK